MRLRHGRILGVIVAATMAAVACSKGEAEAPAAGGGGKGGGGGRAGRGGGNAAVPVTTAVVVQQDVPREIIAIGAAEASRIVQVRAQVTGVLTNVNFVEGDDVKKG